MIYTLRKNDQLRYCRRCLLKKVDGERLSNFERFFMGKDGQPNTAHTAAILWSGSGYVML